MRRADGVKLFVLSFFLMLTIGYSNIIVHKPSTSLELLFALIKGIILASAFFLAPLAILYYAQKKKLRITPSVLFALSIEFIWGILTKILGYVQYSRDFLMAGIIGILIIPFVYMEEKKGSIKNNTNSVLD